MTCLFSTVSPQQLQWKCPKHDPVTTIPLPHMYVPQWKTLSFCYSSVWICHTSHSGTNLPSNQRLPFGESMTVADLIVEYVEEMAFQWFSHNIKCMILNCDCLDEFLSSSNSIEPSIQFTLLMKLNRGGKSPLTSLTEHKCSVVRILLHQSKEVTSCPEPYVLEDMTVKE